MFSRNKPDDMKNCLHAEVERRMNEYKINVSEYGKEPFARNDEITRKIMYLLQAEGLTYKEAMQIPAQLKSYLSISFQRQIMDSVVKPFSCGTEQSNQ